MGEKVLQVKELSKFFRQGADPARRHLREDFVRWWRQLTGKAERRKFKLFPALKEVTFELERGDILGIVGRNGAGKSTMLKILAGVLQPSCGEVIYWGRLVSILELGAGFHPDLSGRENVFLNGALLGMSSAEINNRFEAIVEFSELREFIHQPVKYYSNGMYLRLAFSIFAYLESDILLLDEVMAVGDASFRQKSYHQISRLANAGATIILVSHNPDEIRELCNKCLWLEKGRVSALGKPAAVMDEYLERALILEKEQRLDIPCRVDHNYLIWNDGLRIADEVAIFKFGLKARNRPLSKPILLTDDLEITIEFEKLNDRHPVEVTVSILSLYGAWVLVDSYGIYPEFDDQVKQKGRYICKCIVPSGILNFGFYQLGFLISRAEQLIYQEPALMNFKIQFSADESVKEHLAREAASIVKPVGQWEIERR